MSDGDAFEKAYKNAKQAYKKAKGAHEELMMMAFNERAASGAASGATASGSQVEIRKSSAASGSQVEIRSGSAASSSQMASLDEENDATSQVASLQEEEDLSDTSPPSIPIGKKGR